MKKLLFILFFSVSPSLFSYPYTYEQITPYYVERRAFVPRVDNYIEYVPIQRTRIVQRPVTYVDYYEKVEQIIVNKIQSVNYLGSEQVSSDNQANVIVAPSSITGSYLNGFVYAPNPYRHNMYSWHNFSCYGLDCRVPYLRERRNY